MASTELCPTCQGINIESLAQASGYQHLSLGNLLRSRETCRMCDFLCKAFERLEDLVVREEDLTDMWTDTWSFNMQLTGRPRPKLCLTASNPTGQFVVETLTVHTDEDDPAISVGLLPRLSLPSSMRSYESYATARRWIGDCLSGHPNTRGHMSAKTEIQQLEVCFSNSKERPLRLVHVRPRGHGMLLRLTDALSVDHTYATLSHCVRNSARDDQTTLIDLFWCSGVPVRGHGESLRSLISLTYLCI